MEQRDEELACMAEAMFEILKTISARISEMERIELMDWGRLMDHFVNGCGIQDEIRVQLMEDYILPGLENELTTQEVVEGILLAVRSYKGDDA